ncbi:MAG TPA: hypothetical protein VF529_00095 [Solirubrobacteraceae bacterium]|jgi:hypothetical protein
MSGRRSLRPLLAALAAAAVAICGVLGATGAFAGEPSKREKSAQLARAAPVDVADNSTYFATPAEARSAAATLAAGIPLPAGGNFNGIHWEDIPDGISEGSLLDVLHHNAWCQWTRALAEGREADTARAVLADFESWPTIRGGVEASHAHDVAEGGEAFDAQLAACRGTHTRQVAYAKRKGLVPTR